MSKTIYRIEEDVVLIITDAGNGTSAIVEIKNDCPEYDEVLKTALKLQNNGN